MYNTIDFVVHFGLIVANEAPPPPIELIVELRLVVLFEDHLNELLYDRERAAVWARRFAVALRRRAAAAAAVVVFRLRRSVPCFARVWNMYLQTNNLSIQKQFF